MQKVKSPVWIFSRISRTETCRPTNPSFFARDSLMPKTTGVVDTLSAYFTRWRVSPMLIHMLLAGHTASKGTVSSPNSRAMSMEPLYRISRLILFSLAKRESRGSNSLFSEPEAMVNVVRQLALVSSLSGSVLLPPPLVQPMSNSAEINNKRSSKPFFFLLRKILLSIHTPLGYSCHQEGYLPTKI